MKKYSAPVIEVEILNIPDVITVSGPACPTELPEID